MASRLKSTAQNQHSDEDHGHREQVKSATGFKKITRRSDKANRTYMNLVQRFPLRPIRNDSELESASSMIDELSVKDNPSDEESDYLEVLGDLVRKYEDEHVAMPFVSDADMLRSLMEETGSRQSDVVRGTGISKTVISLVLSGRRRLTREHIEALSRYFEVNPASFLGPNE